MWKSQPQKSIPCRWRGRLPWAPHLPLIASCAAKFHRWSWILFARSRRCGETKRNVVQIAGHGSNPQDSEKIAPLTFWIGRYWMVTFVYLLQSDGLVHQCFWATFVGCGVFKASGQKRTKTERAMLNFRGSNPPNDMVVQQRKVSLVGGLEYFSPYIGNNHPNWLSYFSEGLKPPTRSSLLVPTPWTKCASHSSTMDLPKMIWMVYPWGWSPTTGKSTGNQPPTPGQTLDDYFSPLISLCTWGYIYIYIYIYLYIERERET